MQNNLPHILFCFSGGGNSKYTIEILELLRSIHHEWPPKVSNTDRDFVMEHCWLMNTTRHPHTFLPIDKGKEHNIKAFRTTFATHGVHGTWMLMKSQAPALPTMQAICKHLKKQIWPLHQGISHTEPSKEKNLKQLSIAYTTSQICIEKEDATPKQAQTKFKTLLQIAPSIFLLTK
ncbi:hypothetical protein SERLADRAFT_409752 [Serpula lacrymans var. lacrymans S7.9]|nr:uncharacterized protein SERLADRAFT_409752 [Serpula lacrymans var. lacrymans S7.9]EGO22143.1 hypothetical protein SERLADRAFT_409752 [Serpula lacrymans var. lacrymans S7.9]